MICVLLHFLLRQLSPNLLAVFVHHLREEPALSAPGGPGSPGQLIRLFDKANSSDVKDKAIQP